jgi:hypothetical protein
MTREKKNLFHQRKKGESITYKGIVEPIPLPFGGQEGSEWPWPPDKLTLQIKASPQDWKTLCVLAEAAPEYLGNLIRLHITTSVDEKFLLKEGSNLPRGLHNEERQIYMEQARRYAAAAYAVLSHWAKRPLHSWPEYLKAEIREAEKTLGEDNIWPPPREIEKTLGKESIWPPKKKSHKKKSIDVIAVLKFLIISRYGSKEEALGLDNMEYMDNNVFRKIYLDNNKIEAANDFINKYKGTLTIYILYKVIQIFLWVYVKDVKE